jgi:Ceramidase
MITHRDLALAFGLTILSMIATTLLLGALGPDWSLYAPATCTSTRCFCEWPRVNSLIVQPANSWSSYGYAFVGFLMIVLARGRRWQSAFPPIAASVFGVAAIFVGLGSVLLHATLTLWGQFLDVAGMYFTGGFMVVSTLACWRGFSGRQAAVVYVVIVGILLGLLYAVPEVRRWLFAVVLIAAILIEMIFARPRRPGAKVHFYGIGFLIQAVAFMIWNVDQNGLVCAPNSLLQGHAVWHLLGATALWFTFLYYRSEGTGRQHKR